MNRMSHPESLACQTPARGYLGWDVAADELSVGESGEGHPERESAARALGPWRPVSTSFIALYGPNLWQYLSGQHWLACVLLPRDAPYAGSVRGGPAGPASSAFSLCWNREVFVPSRDGGLRPSTHGRDHRRGQGWTTSRTTGRRWTVRAAIWSGRRPG